MKKRRPSTSKRTKRTSSWDHAFLDKCVLEDSSIFLGKGLIICNNYNLELVHFWAIFFFFFDVSFTQFDA